MCCYLDFVGNRPPISQSIDSLYLAWDIGGDSGVAGALDSYSSCSVYIKPYDLLPMTLKLLAKPYHARVVTTM